MPKRLVIVESPTKANTLSRYLGSEYVIKPSSGHIMDLPKKKLGVDIEHGFTPEYVILPKKNKVVNELKLSAGEADEIYLATDPDREGEAIAQHISELLRGTTGSTGTTSTTGDKKARDTLGTRGTFKRVVFHEITKEAIKQAFEHPRELNQDLFYAQQARRVLDRLVGYKLSPLLWRKVRPGLSAGRVQSVALRLVVDREKERQAFKRCEYWELEAELQAKSQKSQPMAGPPLAEKVKSKEFLAKLIERNEKKIEIKTKEQVDGIIKSLEGASYKVGEIRTSERKRNPYPPYTTSTLQQAGVNVLGFSSKKTMALAQMLYEEGLITYHRTDSTALSRQALNQIRSYIETQFGSRYLPRTARVYKTKSKLAQEAHEAIRPTDLSQKSKIKSQKLGRDMGMLHELIWKRAVACQMNPAVYEQIQVNVDARCKMQDARYLFRAAGSRLMFDGWLRVYTEDGDTRRVSGHPPGAGGQKAGDTDLPELKEGEVLELLGLTPSQHFTEPPPRYTEATLIKALEEYGIGRPSTYAPTISTIIARGYVTNEGRNLKPETVGVVVSDLLVEHFPNIVDLEFTATMEGDLDRIASGEKNWVSTVSDFYWPFEERLEQKNEELQKSAVTTLEEVKETCPQCGKPLAIKLGRYGKFLTCTGFPECRFSKSFTEKVGECQKCGGKAVVKRTKRGKTFYGCSNYPKCDFASWVWPPRGGKHTDGADDDR